MSAPWWVEMDAEYCVLKLREYLVRYDENIAAHRLMQYCIPYFLDDAAHPAIARAREEQAQMVDHIFGDSYAHYYETNHHERAFEEQYRCEPEKAHEALHRVRFLRRWLEVQMVDDGYAEPPPPLTLLDLACNDGWMAKNLEGLVVYTGLDLNPHCIKRAKQRKVPGTCFHVAFAEDAAYEGNLFDVVVAYELIEHVKNPTQILEVMAACAKPGGSLFVSTPLGAGTAGDLPMWHHVEPKGHVRAFTPESFLQLLAPHCGADEFKIHEWGRVIDYAELHADGRQVGTLEVTATQGHGQLMVARIETPQIVAGNGTKPVRADRARRKSDPRPARGPAPAKR